MAVVDKIEELTKGYFSGGELLSPDGLLGLERGVVLMDEGLLRLLGDFREWLGSGLLVNHGGLKYRGFRSWGEHCGVYRRLGREPVRYSQHLYGRAVDVSGVGIGVEELLGAVLEWNGKYPDRRFSGIGVYSSFVHLDVGMSTSGEVRRWIG